MARAKRLGPAVDEGVPKEEFDLACAIAEAKARGLSGTTGRYFQGSDGKVASSTDDDLAACCAVGGLMLCGIGGEDTTGVIHGNDDGDGNTYYNELPEKVAARCTGITLGAAFAHAMDTVRANGEVAE